MMKWMSLTALLFAVAFGSALADASQPMLSRFAVLEEDEDKDKKDDGTLILEEKDDEETDKKDDGRHLFEEKDDEETDKKDDGLLDDENDKDKKDDGLQSEDDEEKDKKDE